MLSWSQDDIKLQLAIETESGRKQPDGFCSRENILHSAELSPPESQIDNSLGFFGECRYHDFYFFLPEFLPQSVIIFKLSLLFLVDAYNLTQLYF